MAIHPCPSTDCGGLQRSNNASSYENIIMQCRTLFIFEYESGRALIYQHLHLFRS